MPLPNSRFLAENTVIRLIGFHTLALRLTVLCAIMSLAASSWGAQPQKNEPRSDPFQRSLRDAHNKERRKVGKPPLEISPVLVTVAQAHARDMAQRQQMAHEGSDGSHVEDRVKRAGYRFLRTAENVAAGHKTVAPLMKDWMTSAGHSANILGDYTEIGAARVAGRDGVNYWVVVFGTPAPVIEPAELPKQALQAINEQRQRKSLAILTSSPVLARVATSAAQQLVAQDKPIVRDQGRSIYEKARAEGYVASSIRLSVAAGQFRANELAEGLAESPDRERTILGTHQHVGVGVAVGPDGLPVWVILWASPADESARDSSSNR